MIIDCFESWDPRMFCDACKREVHPSAVLQGQNAFVGACWTCLTCGEKVYGTAGQINKAGAIECYQAAKRLQQREADEDGETLDDLLRRHFDELRDVLQESQRDEVCDDCKATL